MNEKVGINQRAGGYFGNTHRVIWKRYNGEIPKGSMIHHINGKKRDNRIENLECCSRKEHGKLSCLPNRKRIVYPSGAVKVIKV